MPKISAEHVEVQVDRDLRRLFIDGQEFPYCTAGISYVRDPGGSCGRLTVTFLVDRYVETDMQGRAVIEQPVPPGRTTDLPLKRPDLPGMRQPGEGLAAGE